MEENNVVVDERMSDEELEKRFIGGKNPNKIYSKMKKRGSFNFAALLLTAWYFIYRKMYMAGIIIGVMIFTYLKILTILQDGSSLSPIIYSIAGILPLVACGFMFYPLYNIHVNNKINSIKQSSKNNEELVEKIAKQGGTNLAIAILAFVLLALGTNIIETRI